MANTNLKAYYAANAVSLRKMRDKLAASGKAIMGGYTLAELDQHVAEYERLASMDEAQIRAHVAESMKAIAARVGGL